MLTATPPSTPQTCGPSRATHTRQAPRVSSHGAPLVLLAKSRPCSSRGCCTCCSCAHVGLWMSCKVTGCFWLTSCSAAHLQGWSGGDPAGCRHQPGPVHQPGATALVSSASRHTCPCQAGRRFTQLCASLPPSSWHADKGCTLCATSVLRGSTFCCAAGPVG